MVGDMMGGDRSGGRVPEPILSFEIVTDSLPDIQFVGRFLSHTGQAYRAYARRRYGRTVDSHLVIRRLEISSVFGDLMAVAEAAETIWNHREILAGFVTHVQDAVGAILTGSTGSIPKETKALLKTTSQALADHDAKQVVFNNSGTINGNVVIINQGNAEDILKAVNATATRVSTDNQARLEAPLPRTQLPVWDDDNSSVQIPTGRLVSIPFGFAPDKAITVHNVSGRWYGRIHGQSDVLLPLFSSSWTLGPLKDGYRYLWQGELKIDAHGHPIGINLTYISEMFGE